MNVLTALHRPICHLGHFKPMLHSWSVAGLLPTLSKHTESSTTVATLEPKFWKHITFLGKHINLPGSFNFFAMNRSLLFSLSSTWLRTFTPGTFNPSWGTFFLTTLCGISRFYGFITQTVVYLFQSCPAVTGDRSRLKSASTGDRTRTESCVSPSIGVGFIRLYGIFWYTVLVFDPDVCVLIQKYDINCLCCRSNASQMIWRRESLRFSIIMPPRPSELHWPWEIDSPVSIEVVVTAHISATQIVVGGCDFMDVNISSSRRDEQHIVITWRSRLS